MSQPCKAEVSALSEEETGAPNAYFMREKIEKLEHKKYKVA
jgi:predicted DNA-binding protein